MSNKLVYKLSKVILGIFALYFLYLFTQALEVVNRRYLGTSNGTYINSTTENPELYALANELTQECQDKTCQVQSLLDYVSNIPYRINDFNAHSPQQTIKLNFGDCDDKSNLLISLLHELNIESYFVLVPKHIFVIVSLDEMLPEKKALYLDNIPFYILESTSKNSKVGFPFKYKIAEIREIIEPFENRKLEIDRVDYK